MLKSHGSDDLKIEMGLAGSWAWVVVLVGKLGSKKCPYFDGASPIPVWLTKD